MNSLPSRPFSAKNRPSGWSITSAENSF